MLAPAMNAPGAPGAPGRPSRRAQVERLGVKVERLEDELRAAAGVAGDRVRVLGSMKRAQSELDDLMPLGNISTRRRLDP